MSGPVLDTMITSQSRHTAAQWILDLMSWGSLPSQCGPGDQMANRLSTQSSALGNVWYLQKAEGHACEAFPVHRGSTEMTKAVQGLSSSSTWLVGMVSCIITKEKPELGLEEWAGLQEWPCGCWREVGSGINRGTMADRSGLEQWGLEDRSSGFWIEVE